MKLKKAKKIMFYSTKGGTGKSTAVLISARAFAQKGFKVCVIDVDPQGNLSETILGDRIFQDDYISMADIFTVQIDEDKVRNSINHVDENLDMIGSDINLCNSEMNVRVYQMCDQSRLLKKIISVIESDYDLILMDFNPYPSLLTTNGFVASDLVIIPTICDEWGANGIGITLSLINQINVNFEKKILYKVFVNQISRNNDDKAFMKEIEEQLSDEEIFKTKIRYQAKPFKDKQRGIFEYNKGNSNVAKEWSLLLEEIEREVEK